MHLQLPLHFFLQSYLMSFFNASTIVGKSDQFGFHFLFSYLHTNFSGLRLGRDKSKAWCKGMQARIDLLIFCNRVPSVSGIFSMVTPPGNISWRALFTSAWEEFLLYITQTKRCILLNILVDRVASVALEPSLANILVITGMTSHVSQAFFSSYTFEPGSKIWADESVKNISALYFCSPRAFSISRTACTL